MKMHSIFGLLLVFVTLYSCERDSPQESQINPESATDRNFQRIDLTDSALNHERTSADVIQDIPKLIGKKVYIDNLLSGEFQYDYYPDGKLRRFYEIEHTRSTGFLDAEITEEIYTYSGNQLTTLVRSVSLLEEEPGLEQLNFSYDETGKVNKIEEVLPEDPSIILNTSWVEYEKNRIIVTVLEEDTGREIGKTKYVLDSFGRIVNYVSTNFFFEEEISRNLQNFEYTTVARSAEPILLLLPFSEQKTTDYMLAMDDQSQDITVFPEIEVLDFPPEIRKSISVKVRKDGFVAESLRDLFFNNRREFGVKERVEYIYE